MKYIFFIVSFIFLVGCGDNELAKTENKSITENAQIESVSNESVPPESELTRQSEETLNEKKIVLTSDQIEDYGNFEYVPHQFNKIIIKSNIPDIPVYVEIQVDNQVVENHFFRFDENGLLNLSLDERWGPIQAKILLVANELIVEGDNITVKEGAQPDLTYTISPLEIPDQITIGTPIFIKNYEITVREFSLVQDYKGRNVLKIVYDWKNNNSEPKAATHAFSFKGFQNGIEIDSTPFSDEIDYGIGQKQVQPGYEQKGVETGLMLDTLDPITLELEQWLSFSDNKWTVIIDPNELN